MWWVSIDPGKQRSWVAMWDGDTFVRACSYADGGFSDVQPWFGCVGVAVVERMVHYPAPVTSARASATAQDLIDVTAAGSLLAGRLVGSRGRVHYVDARVWKGSVPKTVTRKRVMEEFARRPSAEQGALTACLQDTPPSLQHNLIDAVGIGLYALKSNLHLRTP